MLSQVLPESLFHLPWSLQEDSLASVSLCLQSLTLNGPAGLSGTCLFQEGLPNYQTSELVPSCQLLALSWDSTWTPTQSTLAAGIRAPHTAGSGLERLPNRF